MSQNAIEFRHITKEFPGIKANDDVSFKVKKGTIHALIGENGAGKSTLMSMLFGLYEPTSGEILINDKKVFFKGPNDATNYGIGMVHQHFKLVKVFSNLDNIILGSEWTKNNFIDRKIATDKIISLQEKYNLNFDLKMLSGDSTVSTQQKVEIMKMLFRDNDILIFDEPTAVLTDEEIQGLLKSFEIFREAGKTILFITHKLREIQQVSDYATVLRHGKVIGTYDVKTTPMDEIVKAMVGSNVVMAKNNLPTERKKIIFELQNISTKNQVKNLQNLSLKIHAGEIFAIAGVEGNGQRELEQICSGMILPSEGKIYKANQNGELIDITKDKVLKRSKNGISFIPTDRHAHGLVLDYNIQENSILRRLWDKKFQTFTWIKNRSKKEFTNEIIEKYDVRGALNGYAQSRSLSGGNQQKFIVGREIETPHEFIIIMQPTRGLDVKAINNIHQQIIKEKENGKGILLISYELDEVLSLADTIGVINEGELVAIKDAKEITRSQIGEFMASKKENK